jgi:hypothetical protein
MQIHTPRFLLAAAFASLVMAAGCLMQPTWDATATTEDGVVVNVPLSNSKTDVVEGDVEVNLLQFLPLTGKDGNKRLSVVFQMVFHHGAKPSSIIVTDVTESPVLTVYGDYSPKIGDKTGIWRGATEPLSPSNALLKFLTNIDNSIRIYRFTVKLTDGSTEKLNVPMLVPGFYKEFMLKEAGG